MSSEQHNRVRAEREHRLISQLLLEDNTKELKKQCGTKEFAEQRLLALEKYLNYESRF